MKRILSIDGGGIRGIIPLCALIELEKQTGKPTRELFDFIAGTSTGSIIAGGLSQGLPATRCLELYQEAGPTIFKRDYILWLTSLFSYKYRTAPMHGLIKKYIGDPKINESPIDLMITSTRVSDGKNWYFVKDNAGNAQSTGELSLTDCITASAAAPTFFEPWNVKDIGACVDGGVGIASNPVYQACVEAFYFTGGAYIPEETIVVSLGTGYYDSKKNPANIIDWVLFLIGELLDAPSQQQLALVLRHFNQSRSYRWNVKFDHDIGLDGINAIPELIAIGTREAQATLQWAGILDGSSNDHLIVPNSRATQRNLK